MKAIKRHIIFLFLIGLLSSACQKDDAQLLNEDISAFKFLEGYAGTPSFLTTGNDFFCFSIEQEHELGGFNRRLVFANNIGEQISNIALNSIGIWQILYDGGDEVSVFSTNGTRMRLRTDGSGIDTIPNFLEGLESNGGYTYVPSDVQRLTSGNYVVYGYLTGLKRAFISLHTPDGVSIFKKLYFLSSPEINVFTGLVEKSDGTLLVLGSHPSNTPEEPNEVFLLNYNLEGELIAENVLEYGPGLTNDIFNYSEQITFSRELIDHGNNTYTCILNRPDPSALEQFVELLTVDNQGITLNSQRLDFAPKNIATSCTMRKGQSNFGIVSQTAVFPGNRIQYSYHYEIDANGMLVDHKVIDRGTNNSLSEIEVLGNQDIALLGEVQSFNSEIRPFLMLNNQ